MTDFITAGTRGFLRILRILPERSSLRPDPSTIEGHPHEFLSRREPTRRDVIDVR